MTLSKIPVLWEQNKSIETNNPKEIRVLAEENKTAQQKEELETKHKIFTEQHQVKAHVGDILNKESSISEFLARLETQLDAEWYTITDQLSHKFEEKGYMDEIQVAEVKKQTPLSYPIVIWQMEAYFKASKERLNSSILTMESELAKMPITSFAEADTQRSYDYMIS